MYSSRNNLLEVDPDEGLNERIPVIQNSVLERRVREIASERHPSPLPLTQPPPIRSEPYGLD